MGNEIFAGEKKELNPYKTSYEGMIRRVRGSLRLGVLGSLGRSIYAIMEEEEEEEEKEGWLAAKQSTILFLHYKYFKFAR